MDDSPDKLAPPVLSMGAARGFLRCTAAALLTLPLLAVSPPVQAVDVQSLIDDLCQYYVLDSDTCSAKTVIDCLVKSGGSMDGMQKCAADYDPKARKFIDIYGAATKPDYVRLIELAGPVIACKLLPPGPPTDILCSVALKPIVTKAFSKAAQIYQAAADGDWLTLIYAVGNLTIACDLVPGFPGKEITCGALAQILNEGAKLLQQGAAAGVDVLESGVEALGDLAGEGLKSLGLGTSGVAPENIFYRNSAKPLLHQRALKRLMGAGAFPFLGFDAALMKACTGYVNMPGSQAAYAATVCKHKSQQLHDEASALANLVAVAPGAYFENIQATASLLLATNFWSGKAEEFNAAIQKLPQAKWSAEGFQSLPSPFSAVLGNCFANTRNLFPVPLAPGVTGPLTPPSLWGWVCQGAGLRLSWALLAEKERITKQVIPQLTTAGCILAKTGDDSLKFDCSNGVALTMCMARFAAAMPNSRCRRSAPVEKVEFAPLGQQQAPDMQLPESVVVSPSEPAPPQVVAPPRGLASAMRVGEAAGPGAMALAIEAEALARSGAIQVAGGRADVQPMGGFGRGWSGGEQLFWSGGGVGAWLELTFDVPVAAHYVVEMNLTRAPDYGQLNFAIGGQASGVTFDGAGPGVEPSGPVRLGAFSLPAGANAIRVTIIGKHARSSGYFAGIDTLRLVPTASRD
jgi:hypothetical protein